MFNFISSKPKQEGADPLSAPPVFALGLDELDYLPVNLFDETCDAYHGLFHVFDRKYYVDNLSDNYKAIVSEITDYVKQQTELTSSDKDKKREWFYTEQGYTSLKVGLVETDGNQVEDYFYITVELVDDEKVLWHRDETPHLRISYYRSLKWCDDIGLTNILKVASEKPFASNPHVSTDKNNDFIVGFFEHLNTLKLTGMIHMAGFNPENVGNSNTALLLSKGLERINDRISFELRERLEQCNPVGFVERLMNEHRLTDENCITYDIALEDRGYSVCFRPFEYKLRDLDLAGIEKNVYLMAFSTVRVPEQSEVEAILFKLVDKGFKIYRNGVLVAG